MYSLMSIRIRASSSSNRKAASARASSVFPTPVGPRKMNEPIGRLGSRRPTRLRRTARDTAASASSCPTTRRRMSSSIRSSFCLLLRQLDHRDSRHGGEHVGDQVLVDVHLLVALGLGPRLLVLVAPRSQLLL